MKNAAAIAESPNLPSVEPPTRPERVAAGRKYALRPASVVETSAVRKRHLVRAFGIVALVALGQVDDRARAQIPVVRSPASQSPVPATFESLDVNEDGFLSGRELKSVAARDADGNGRVTRTEFQGSSETAAGGSAAGDASLFAERDITEDGYLSGTEAAGLEALDADRNGKITKEEFLTGRAAARGAARYAGDIVGGRAAFEAGARRLATAGFMAADKDRDRFLSREEAGDSFPAADTDGDGRISLVEFIPVEAAKISTPQDASAAALSLLIGALADRDVRPLMLVMHEELRREVEEAVLALFVQVLREECGQVAEVKETRFADVMISGKWANSAVIDVVFAKGTTGGKLVVSTVDGAVVGFRLRFPAAERINDILYARISVDSVFAKAAGGAISARGRRLVQSVLQGRDEEAYGMLDTADRVATPIAEAKATFEEIRTRTGTCTTINFLSTNVPNGDDGKPASLLLISYNVAAEHGNFAAIVTCRFDGYRLALLGLNVEKLKK